MDGKQEQQVVLIAGPTASGKSAAALEVAGVLGGEIVNADAMQVYRDLRILTARPSDKEMAHVPHHLYGTMDGAESCSAGIWARQAAPVIKQIQLRGKVPIVVGGTGLYFKALDEGLSPIPDIPAEIREKGQALFDMLGPEAFRRRVVEADPEMARLPENDRQRLVRAWEVYTYTGKRLSEFQALPRQSLLNQPAVKCIISPPRDKLYQQCDTRFEAMMNQGALQEVEALLARNLNPAQPVMKSLGVPELTSHLLGQLSLEEATELARRNTRRFAKRQQTWFSGQANDWPRFAAPQQVVAFLAENCSMSRRGKR